MQDQSSLWVVHRSHRLVSACEKRTLPRLLGESSSTVLAPVYLLSFDVATVPLADHFLFIFMVIWFLFGLLSFADEWLSRTETFVGVLAQLFEKFHVSGFCSCPSFPQSAGLASTPSMWFDLLWVQTSFPFDSYSVLWPYFRLLSESRCTVSCPTKPVTEFYRLMTSLGMYFADSSWYLRFLPKVAVINSPPTPDF